MLAGPGPTQKAVEHKRITTNTIAVAEANLAAPQRRERVDDDARGSYTPALMSAVGGGRGTHP